MRWQTAHIQKTHLILSVGNFLFETSRYGCKGGKKTSNTSKHDHVILKTTHTTLYKKFIPFRRVSVLKFHHRIKFNNGEVLLWLWRSPEKSRHLKKVKITTFITTFILRYWSSLVFLDSILNLLLYYLSNSNEDADISRK